LIRFLSPCRGIEICHQHGQQSEGPSAGAITSDEACMHLKAMYVLISLPKAS